jgi:hypothetical protein
MTLSCRNLCFRAERFQIIERRALYVIIVGDKKGGHGAPVSHAYDR